MSISEFFVKRPVFSTVISLIIVLVGLVCQQKTDILELPRVEYPVITVESSYPGASPDVMEMNVTKILEEAFGTIQGVDHMNSRSLVGQSSITITFNNSVKMDTAANDVRDQIFRVQSHLPRDMETPTVRRARGDETPIVSLVFESEIYDVNDVRERVEKFIKNKVSVLNGVSSVMISGGCEYAMNIRLDSQKLAAYNLTPADINNAIRTQSRQAPGGVIKSDTREFAVVTKGELITEQQFNDMILSNNYGKIIRLKDVGYAKRSAKDVTTANLYNGKNTVSLHIYKQSVANPISVVDGIKKALPELQEVIGKNIKISISRNSADYIEKSINSVYRTIFEAVILVIGIVFLFLWSFKSSLIPLITIPVSLIGTFTLMYCFNCTVNTITLLALVLAVGLVVDDAIVVLENVYRYLERGYTAAKAAIKGTGEITFAIISMTLTLAAVYAPIGMADGNIGKYFSEFAVVLSGSVILSGIVALTLSPMMCSKFLTNNSTKKSFGAESHKNFLNSLDNIYKKILDKIFNVRWLIILLGLMISIGGFLLAYFKIPACASKADRGVFLIRAFGPIGSSYEYMKGKADKIDEIMKQLDYIQSRSIDVKRDCIDVYAKLVDWKYRPKSVFEIKKQAEEKISDIPGLEINAMSGSEDERQFISLVLQTDKGYNYLSDQGEYFARYLMMSVVKEGKYPSLTGRSSSEVTNKSQEINVIINRERAASLGVDVNDVSTAIEYLFRGVVSTKIKNSGKICDVFVQLDDKLRTRSQDIMDVYVRGKYNVRGDSEYLGEYTENPNEEKMVQLSDLVELTRVPAPTSLNHYNQMLSRSYYLEVQKGHGIKEGIRDVLQLKDDYLPDDVKLSFIGETKQFIEDQNKIYFIFGMALIFIFLVLSAQFESFVDPFIILLSVPLAISGALIVLFFVKDGSLNIYSEIGLITLIGLIAKHGILIVDFANHLCVDGKTKIEAVKEAAVLRLRPILMTTLAMVIGVVPLIMAKGVGCESKIQIGWVIFGGMLFGTLFTLFFVPVVYSFLSRDKKREEI